MIFYNFQITFILSTVLQDTWKEWNPLKKINSEDIEQNQMNSEDLQKEEFLIEENDNKIIKEKKINRGTKIKGGIAVLLVVILVGFGIQQFIEQKTSNSQRTIDKGNKGSKAKGSEGSSSGSKAKGSSEGSKAKGSSEGSEAKGSSEGSEAKGSSKGSEGASQVARVVGQRSSGRLSSVKVNIEKNGNGIGIPNMGNTCWLNTAMNVILLFLKDNQQFADKLFKVNLNSISITKKLNKYKGYQEFLIELNKLYRVMIQNNADNEVQIDINIFFFFFEQKPFDYMTHDSYNAITRFFTFINEIINFNIMATPEMLRNYQNFLKENTIENSLYIFQKQRKDQSPISFRPIWMDKKKIVLKSCAFQDDFNDQTIENKIIYLQLDYNIFVEYTSEKKHITLHEKYFQSKKTLKINNAIFNLKKETEITNIDFSQRNLMQIQVLDDFLQINPNLINEIFTLSNNRNQFSHTRLMQFVNNNINVIQKFLSDNGNNLKEEEKKTVCTFFIVWILEDLNSCIDSFLQTKKIEEDIRSLESIIYTTPQSLIKNNFSLFIIQGPVEDSGFHYKGNLITENEIIILNDSIIKKNHIIQKQDGFMPCIITWIKNDQKLIRYIDQLKQVS